MAAKVTKIKLFTADDLGPKNPTDGTSLEEQLNVFLAPIASADFMDVVVNTAKSGKYGSNPVFTAAVLYKG